MALRGAPGPCKDPCKDVGKMEMYTLRDKGEGREGRAGGYLCLSQFRAVDRA